MKTQNRKKVGRAVCRVQVKVRGKFVFRKRITVKGK